MSREKNSQYRTLGERLREARENKGLGQDALGRQLGYTPGYVSHVETGKQKNPSQRFMRAAEAWIQRASRGYDLSTSPIPLAREVPATKFPTPPKMKNDDRLQKAVAELSDILQGLPEAEIGWLLGNIEMFAREARRHLGVKKRAG